MIRMLCSMIRMLCGMLMLHSMIRMYIYIFIDSHKFIQPRFL